MEQRLGNQPNPTNDRRNQATKTRGHAQVHQGTRCTASPVGMVVLYQGNEYYAESRRQAKLIIGNGGRVGKEMTKLGARKREKGEERHD